jgi:hypothetical protein
MSRKANPSSQYKVSIHMNNGYRYASTQPFRLDPKSGKKIYRHVHWGTVDENNKFVPGIHYFTASIEERSKLIFPQSWDLSETSKLSGARNKGKPATVSQDENRLYGDTWLLEQIAGIALAFERI